VRLEEHTVAAHARGGRTAARAVIDSIKRQPLFAQRRTTQETHTINTKPEGCALASGYSAASDSGGPACRTVLAPSAMLRGLWGVASALPVAVVIHDHVALLHVVGQEDAGQGLQPGDVVSVLRQGRPLLPSDTVVVLAPEGGRSLVGSVVRRTDNWLEWALGTGDGHSSVRTGRGLDVPLGLVVGRATHVVWPLEHARRLH